MSRNLIHESLKPHLFPNLTPIQDLAIPRILSGENLLLISPTGGGKTEAAFIPILSLYLSFRDKFGKIPGVHVIYITPLRALNRDIVRRMKVWCDMVGVEISIRHGDTPSSVRRLQLRNPPEVLVTTPESLQAILPAAGMRGWLRNVKWVIIDEAHNLVRSKRGTQLAFALQRLKLISGKFQTILLSATISNPGYVSKFFCVDDEIKVLIDPSIKPFELHVENPIPDSLDYDFSLKCMCNPNVASRVRRIIGLINNSKSTIVFVNCREYAEYLCSRLRLAGLDVYSHHSSLSRGVRELIESRFKSGDLKCIVATSSLELGIDVGFVDSVVQYLSPRQVSTLIQRVGRSGHALGRVSKGFIICNGFNDVLESMVICRMALDGDLEDLPSHEGALDVLAHQIVGLILDFNGIGIDDAYRIVTSSYPYRNLDFKSFSSLLDYMVTLDIIKVSNGFLAPSRRSRKYYYEHLSTIPEEIKFPVKVESSGEDLGFLGEDFFSEYVRPGVKIILRGRPWVISRISDFEVYVNQSTDYIAAIPGWEGEVLPTPRKVALKVGSLIGKIYDMWINGMSIDDMLNMLHSEFPFGFDALKYSIKPIIDYFEMGFPPPTDKRVVIESFDKFIVIHSFNGHGVNRALSKIINTSLMDRFGIKCISRFDAYRILLMVEGVSGGDIANIISNLDLETAHGILYSNVDPYFIRHVALKFNAIPKGLQYKTTSYLMHLPEIFYGTPVYDEAYRFELVEHFDFEGLKDFINGLRSGVIEVKVLEKSSKPSSLAMPIIDVGDIQSLTSEELFAYSIFHKTVNFVCMDCLKVWRVAVKDVSEPIKCPYCGSIRVALVKWRVEDVLRVLSKIKSSEPLNDNEDYLATYCRMSSDLILLYGVKAVIALAVKGVGPLTAHQILAKSHKDLESFLRDLMDAMREYMDTRAFWNES